eukprot:1660357-Pyramimonas_sp.AAC.1
MSCCVLSCSSRARGRIPGISGDHRANLRSGGRGMQGGVGRARGGILGIFGDHRDNLSSGGR